MDKKRSDCPISAGLDIFGDKWSLLIIRDLMFTTRRSYGELQSGEEKIATNILASRLSILEHAGIIRKEIDPTNRRKSLYFLTESGIDLAPVIVELGAWAIRNLESMQNGSSKIISSATGIRLSKLKEKLRKQHGLND